MSLDLDTLAPAATQTFTITHPETGVTFAAVVRGPYTAAGRIAAERVVFQANKAKDLTPEQDAAESEDFAVAVLLGLPDITVNGGPVPLDTPDRVRAVCVAIPYLAGQLLKQYLQVFGFFSSPSAPSLPTSATSESSDA